MENGSRAAELLIEASRSPAARSQESFTSGSSAEPSCARGCQPGAGEGGAGPVEMEPRDPLESAQVDEEGEEEEGVDRELPVEGGGCWVLPVAGEEVTGSAEEAPYAGTVGSRLQESVVSDSFG
eukprot:TRINITY_DN4671_c2_g1_i1.p2 TRINITY_DN4671_c2_g1~~TRINITY_DN4671_c2_g1_i1.p2  ORF type:complete len:124 (-),score=18.92 TRINITY_DN4671_c2_g1_i1:374-745(-)